MLLALLLVAGSAGTSHARLLFGFLPPRSTETDVTQLQQDLLSRLERTSRYGLIVLNTGGTDVPEDLKAACILRPELDKTARLVLAKKEKYESVIEVFDCRRGEADPPRINSRSGKLSSLAGSLRDDFIGAYPMLLELEVEAGRLLVAAGPREKVIAGSALYSYRESSPHDYQLLGKFRVGAYQEGSFRSLLQEDYRVPAAGRPISGEILSPELLVTRSPRALSRPELSPFLRAGRLLIGRPAPAAMFLPEPVPLSPGTFEIKEGPSHVLQESAAPVPGTGRALSLDAVLEPGATLVIGWRSSVKGRYEAHVGGGGVSLRRVDLQGSKQTGAVTLLASAPLLNSTLRTSVQLVCYGPWAELYVDGLFAAGFEDAAYEEGSMSIAVRSGRAEIYGVALYELEPADKKRKGS